MGLPPFFERVYAAAGGVLSLSRTSLEQKLGDITVGVELDPAWERAAGTYAADLAVNLAARLYGALSLRGSERWVGTAAQLARAINPQVEISEGEPTIGVVIGNIPRNGNTVYARSDGWVASVLATPKGDAPGPRNPFAAGMSGSLAMAEVFRRAFGAHMPQARAFEGVSVSLLDFSATSGALDPLTSVDVGEVAFAGLGAVANGALSALAQLESVKGSLLLVDGQFIDVGNLQRYALAAFADVGTSKAQLARNALANTGATLVPQQVAFEDLAERMTLPPVIVVSVDNVPTRRAVQALLPRLAINGWTSDQGLGASWHDFAIEAACLACDYHPIRGAPSQYDLVMSAFGLSRERVYSLWLTEGGVEPADLDVAAAHMNVERSKLEQWLGSRIQDFFTSVVCGQVALDLSSGRGPLEAVPLAHQSVMAGILMAAELVKRTNPEIRARAQGSVHIAWENVLQATPRRWTIVRKPAHNCICRDEIYRQRYASKWL